MKKKYRSYMPLRFVLNMLLILIETALVMTIVVLISIRNQYSFIAELVTQLVVAVVIIASNDNPDYKVPWVFFVLVLPVIGFMFYFMFYSRRLSPMQRRRLRQFWSDEGNLKDSPDCMRLQAESEEAYSQALLLKKLSKAHIYTDTVVTYFPLGDKLFPALLEDLKRAQSFIFLEFFIIQQGEMWNAILDVLKQKASQGVDVRVAYDDIGCMRTLPGDYFKRLNKMGVKCVTFARLRAQANNKFNNRNHRKIAVIDGRVGYTGGINLADEYINRRRRFGHWKDVGVRLEGNAVNELTRLFLADYLSNAPAKQASKENAERFFLTEERPTREGYVVPFGDGPKPIYDRQVVKLAIMNLLGQAKNHVYMMTPYLIIDNELTQAIENAALRGVDVKLITPHIPDKKLVFTMTRSYYKRLMNAGVSIYEYTPGFVHAKMYLADGETAMIGTANLDYRSLVHHFENVVWMFRVPAIADMESDFADTLDKCTEVDEEMAAQHLPGRFVRAIVKIFAPLL